MKKSCTGSLGDLKLGLQVGPLSLIEPFDFLCFFRLLLDETSESGTSREGRRPTPSGDGRFFNNSDEIMYRKKPLKKALKVLRMIKCTLYGKCV